MANRSFNQFTYSMHKMPVHIDCNFAIGATGAVSAVKGTGVYGVTRLAVGTYKIQFQDNYYKFYGVNWNFQSPVSGADVAVTALSAGTMYQITLVGTTTTAQWVTAGLPVGITPAVGVSFLAAATSVGTGTAKVLGNTGIPTVEVIGDSDTQLGPIGTPGQGAYVIIKLLAPTNASTTTLIPTDAAQGSKLYLDFYFSNSSVVVQSE